jgi:hypothetical protein
MRGLFGHGYPTPEQRKNNRFDALVQSFLKMANAQNSNWFQAMRPVSMLHEAG